MQKLIFFKKNGDPLYVSGHVPVSLRYFPVLSRNPSKVYQIKQAIIWYIYRQHGFFSGYVPFFFIIRLEHVSSIVWTYRNISRDIGKKISIS